MRSNELNYRWCRLIGLSSVAALGLGALLPGQAISHTRHVDSGNIHMWWDTNTNYSFGNGGLCGIRDLNGDGHPDVLIGRTEYASGGKGSVLAFSGREGKGVLGTITGAKADEAFGSAIAVIGDVDKDSFDDFVVAAPNATVGTKVQAGYVQLY
ncbi:MAG: FG-GAP-like repeat-containing protein, partial [Planctomycetota bacterium]